MCLAHMDKSDVGIAVHKVKTGTMNGTGGQGVTGNCAEEHARCLGHIDVEKKKGALASEGVQL